MALVASNLVAVQHAAELSDAITGNSTFASWIGWQAFDNGATLEEAIAISKAVEAGDFSLDNLFNSAQSKTGAVDPTGEPNPTLTVNGKTFDIGHLLGDTAVDTWTSGNAKSTQYHSREYFTSVGEDAPKDYDPHWDSPNEAPVANDFTVAGIEGNGTLVINLLDPEHVSDPDGDTLKITEVTLANGEDLPDYMTFNAATGKVTVDLDAAALNDIHKDEIATINLSYTVSDGELEDVGAVKVDITGTADQYHGLVDVSKEFTKTAVNSGNGGQTAESFHFDLSTPAIEDAFDFSGTVTLTVKGDMDGLNENATVAAISGELVDENLSENGLLYLAGTIGNNDDKNGSDIGDNVTVTGSTKVDVDGLDDGHVVFDVAVSGDVDSGSTITATLSYDYWA